MPNSFQHYNFNHLSVKDLVEARDMFHVHLINKRNVVATAIGRYLIRKDDIDENGKYAPQTKKIARTLKNSVVIDISWPCILVFVEKWEDEKTLLKEGASSIVPKTIYMPDGRIVPICIVEAPRNKVNTDKINFEKLKFPTNYLGGGFPVVINSQGIQRVASIACVVGDGHNYYALTNKHVAGDLGTEVNSFMGDEKVVVGFSDGKYLGKVPFSKLYPGWQNNNMLVNCDAGLIKIVDLNRWKTDVVGIKGMDEVLDINTMNLTLGILSEHEVLNGETKDSLSGNVVGFGGISGYNEGEIVALFYRYNSIGGTEYVSDFLISGKNGNALGVRHGDSGTLWFLQTHDENGKTKLQPFALHWGQHEFIDEGTKLAYNYSMATSLTNVCRELDVELIRGWNIDQNYSWGKVGHYTVGNIAIDFIKDAKLKELMENNIENISFNRSDINKDLDRKDNPDLPKDPDTGFCPLADVPDIIWKQFKFNPETGKGSKWGRKGDENPNHYADADAPTKGEGKTLFELCDAKEKLTVNVWGDYYNNIDKEKIGADPDKDVSKGLISFRVWQIYDYMVDAASKGEVDKFIFGGGVLAHYVGDACQPLHSSFMSDGDPADNVTEPYTAKRDSTKHNKGDVYDKVMNPGKGVHVAYEDHMVDDFIGDIMKEFEKIINNPDAPIFKEDIETIDSGQAAGFAVLQLMKKTQETIAPKTIVEAFKAAKQNGSDVSDALFNEFGLGTKTIDCLARGSKYLAAIWEAAWNAPNIQNKITRRGKVSQKSLTDLYRDPGELPSLHLDTIDSILKH